MVRALPKDTAGFVVGKQVARSGTSIGANVEEAKAAQSRADFVRRINIARAEARETLYWLRVITGAGLVPKSRLTELQREADELTRILTVIVKNTRANNEFLNS